MATEDDETIREQFSFRFAAIIGSYLLAAWVASGYPPPETFTLSAIWMHTARMPLWLAAHPVRGLATVPFILYAVWILLVQPYGGRF